MTRTAPPLSKLPRTPKVGHLAPTDLEYTVDLEWNRISSLEHSGTETEILPPGHWGFCSPVAKQTGVMSHPLNAWRRRMVWGKESSFWSFLAEDNLASTFPLPGFIK
ncbi:hypothetical protein AVEN_247845-1 [Araneus ventricosus]|uniref:Uncharacterized protein n=1 Tax=Araneus ventricosus TaxID=182803 RepID=A0A4Y2IDY6_ARAVE|nr:hypothetical protein AVEN_247845-1 [Araneus ventricosus]